MKVCARADSLSVDTPTKCILCVLSPFSFLGVVCVSSHYCFIIRKLYINVLFVCSLKEILR